jgi:type II secretory pathway predicted ATPase ExeA
MTNKSSDYLEAADIFIDNIDAKSFIQREQLVSYYSALLQAIQKPLKLILLYGKPGTGKSMLLNKLFNDISIKSSEIQQKILLYPTPMLDEEEFFLSLAEDLFSKEELRSQSSNYNIKTIKFLLETYPFEKPPVILLDEAQLYSTIFMEKIRLLSDSRLIKFVITLHKTDQEDLIVKEHFKTRIWESIELESINVTELQSYIQKKLMYHNSIDIANMFSKQSVSIIHQYSHGNYRNSNKLLYTLFNIYAYYAQHQPKKINSSFISKSIIEMAAIHVGLINA